MRATDETKRQEGGVAGAVRFWLPVLVLVLVIRSFVFQTFHIPSGSMIPTLLIGDSLAVSKFPYGFSRYSFPLSPPLFSGRVLARPMERGDIVVFRLPTDDSIDLIKRVIGLPHDRVQMLNGVLHINGEPVKRERIEDFIDEDNGGVRVRQFRETLPSGKIYSTLDMIDNGPLDTTEVYEVPDGHYFMMGDNRDDSADSRVLDEVGYVPFENVVGRAEIIYFSIGHDAHAWEVWRWPEAVRWRRLFTILR